MSHSMVKIWIHGVFSTKDRQPLIQENFRYKLYRFISEQLQNDFKCPEIYISGTSDHLHIFFLLNPEYAVSQIFKQIKGSSSHWINQSCFINIQFSWQVGYGAFSVSESLKDKVIAYLGNQKEHHAKHSFEEEYKLFIDKYGLSGGNR